MQINQPSVSKHLKVLENADFVGYKKEIYGTFVQNVHKFARIMRIFYAAIPDETVEKPKKHDFKVYNYLILLHVKFGKMPKLGFFDSLAIKHTYHVQ